MGHKALDEWFDQLVPLFRQSEPPSLETLSERLQETRQQLLGGARQAMVEQLYAGYLQQEIASCPGCGKVLKRKRSDEKEISTLQGRLRVARPYFYCAGCGRGFHPLDGALGVAAQTHQYDIQRELVQLGADLPFQRASDHFRRLSGVEALNHFAHETLNALGTQACLDSVIPTREEIEQRIVQARGSARSRAVLVVASDGAHTPTRPAGKRKDKRAWVERAKVLYLFEDEASVQAYLDGPLAAGVISHPALSEFSVKQFDVMEGVTETTRGPI